MHSNAANASSILLGVGSDRLIPTTDADMESLADYEEEQQRKGHFECLFPTQKNIEEYRGYFSQPRRLNYILWAYIK